MSMALVRDGNDAQKSHAAAALNYFANDDYDDTRDKIAIAIAKAGGIPPLVALVRNGNVEQKKSAADVLEVLAGNEDNKIASEKAKKELLITAGI